MAGIAGLKNTIRQQPEDKPLPAPMDVNIPEEEKTVTTAGNVEITAEDDGSVTVNFAPKKNKAQRTTGFYENLAEDMSTVSLDMIASDLLEGIQNDYEGCAEWRETYTRGIDLLGLKIEPASSEVSGMGTISKVHHPLLLEAVVRSQANARAELLPASGPVKVRNDNPQSTKDQTQLAEALEKDFNHYLTVTAKEYYPDFDRMLFSLYFGGTQFRKPYMCPIRKRPVSEWVSAIDLIVSNDTTDLSNAIRVTQKIMMRQSMLKRMQIAGYYRDVALVQPNEQPSNVDNKIKSVEGVQPNNRIPSDQRYTIYECYAELDPEELGSKEQGAPEGLPLPYKITIDKDSRVILDIRRNWKEGDNEFKKRRNFVMYGIIPGLGFYYYGYIHILGNTTRALTAIERQLLDAGQFANFPGFLKAKQSGRQETNEIRIPPGGGMEIDTGNLPIQQAIMPIPYKEPSAVLAALSDKIAQDGQRLGGTAEVQVGEGRADIPVGTMVAMVEQATKVLSAVHKRLHAAQQEEFEILKELFAEDPTTLWKFAKNPARKWEQAEEFNDIELVPAADPNVPSHIHRIMQAQALVQLVQANPSMYDLHEVNDRVLSVLGIGDRNELFAKQQPQGDPSQAIKLHLDAQKNEIAEKKLEREANSAVLDTQTRIQDQKLEMEDNQADRESKEKIAMIGLAETRLKEAHKGLGATSTHGVNNVR